MFGLTIFAPTENGKKVMEMDEYIRKESAISIFRAKAEMAVCTPAQPYFDCAAKMLELLPAADVAPVRHGWWEKQSGLYSCSECGTTCPYDVQADVIEYWACKYCPNCGAKMDGDHDG